MTAPILQATGQYFGDSAPSWLAITVMILAILTFICVVIPAVFGNASRRRAALRVLDRILRALTGR
jgi:threonine/homoserine/homoserine lactone efflux protein